MTAQHTHIHTKIIIDQMRINLKSEVPVCLDRIIYYEFGHFCSSLYEGIIEVCYLVILLVKFLIIVYAIDVPVV